MPGVRNLSMNLELLILGVRVESLGMSIYVIEAGSP